MSTEIFKIKCGRLSWRKSYENNIKSKVSEVKAEKLEEMKLDFEDENDKGGQIVKRKVWNIGS